MRFAAFLTRRLQKKQGIFISHNALFYDDLVLPHPTGIVIGDGVQLGRNVTVFQNVTLGGARIGDSHKRKYPQVGDGSVIFAGAVVIGDIKLGANCVVGANSVVTKSVPDNCVVSGAPAKVVNKVKNINE
jgi:serine O-acetyltransferase